MKKEVPDQLIEDATDEILRLMTEVTILRDEVKALKNLIFQYRVDTLKPERNNQNPYWVKPDHTYYYEGGVQDDVGDG